MFEKKKLLGVGVTNEKSDDILEYVINITEEKTKKLFIVTPNPEILVFANDHPTFKNLLNTADLALNDGVGVQLASVFLGKPLLERFTGVDFVEKVCEKSVKQPITVGFLGGKPGVADKAAECLIRKYPGLKISFAASEVSKIRSVQDSKGSIKYKVSSIEYQKEEDLKSLNTNYFIPNTDILFVAFGFPKQEEWIHTNLPKIPVRVAIGVGGAFDYISGEVRRAPLFVQKIGLEWLFRLIRQPRRAKRQLALIRFVYLVIKEKLQI